MLYGCSSIKRKSYISKIVKLSNRNFNAMPIQFEAFNTYKRNDTFLDDIVPFVAYGGFYFIISIIFGGIIEIIANANSIKPPLNLIRYSN